MERLSAETLAARFADVEENLKRIEEALSEAALRFGRKREEITLLAATKTVPVEVVNHSIACGVTAIGENKVQELLDKYESYDKHAGLQFIGHLQTNKVKYLIGKVQMIQSVDSVKLAKEISRLSQGQGVTTQVLVEVNIGREENKSGVLPEALEPLLAEIACLPALSVRGLMAIPPATVSETESLHYFSQMYDYFVDIGGKKLDNAIMDYLSMGMSADYAQAIACGANMVRVGSALYGKRDYGTKS